MQSSLGNPIVTENLRENHGILGDFAEVWEELAGTESPNTSTGGALSRVQIPRY